MTSDDIYGAMLTERASFAAFAAIESLAACSSVPA